MIRVDAQRWPASPQPRDASWLSRHVRVHGESHHAAISASCRCHPASPLSQERSIGTCAACSRRGTKAYLVSCCSISISRCRRPSGESTTSGVLFGEAKAMAMQRHQLTRMRGGPMHSCAVSRPPGCGLRSRAASTDAVRRTAYSEFHILPMRCDCIPVYNWSNGGATAADRPVSMRQCLIAYFRSPICSMSICQWVLRRLKRYVCCIRLRRECDA